MNWIQLITGFLSAVLVAVITSVLTVRLALRRFYSEKWWERKISAYTEIIKSLHHVREHAETNLQFSLLQKDLPEEGEKRLTSEMQEAIGQLRLHRDLGILVVSNEAVDLLNILFAELDASTRTQSWHNHLEMKLEAVDKCLSKMRQVARKELNVGSAL